MRHVVSLRIFIKNRQDWDQDQLHQCQITQGLDPKRDLKFLISQDMYCHLNFFSERGEVEIGNTFSSLIHSRLGSLVESKFPTS